MIYDEMNWILLFFACEAIGKRKKKKRKGEEMNDNRERMLTGEKLKRK